VLLAGAIVALLPWQLWLAGQHVSSRFIGGQKWGALSFGQLTDRSLRILGNMAGLWPVPYSTYWAVGAVLLAVALAVLVPEIRGAIAFLGLTLAVIVGGLWLQYLLWELQGPFPVALLDSYMKFNAARVELLPATLVWVLAATAVGGAGPPGRGGGGATAAARSRRGSRPSAGPDQPVPVRSQALAGPR